MVSNIGLLLWRLRNNSQNLTNLAVYGNRSECPEKLKVILSSKLPVTAMYRSNNSLTVEVRMSNEVYPFVDKLVSQKV